MTHAGNEPCRSPDRERPRRHYPSPGSPSTKAQPQRRSQRGRQVRKSSSRSLSEGSGRSGIFRRIERQSAFARGREVMDRRRSRPAAARKVLVDLLAVVRHSLRASVYSYPLRSSSRSMALSANASSPTPISHLPKFRAAWSLTTPGASTRKTARSSRHTTSTIAAPRAVFAAGSRPFVPIWLPAARRSGGQSRKTERRAKP